jgi:phage tail-like protein
MASTDFDPYGNYYFALEIGSTEVGHFMECSGLKNASAVFEIEEGGLNGRTHKRVGQSKWENLVLRYASSNSTFMVEWRDKWLQDKFTDGLRTAFSGAIRLCDNSGATLRTYSFKNAWPVSWEGPSFNSGSSELAIETLEIAHDGLEIS